MKVCGRLLFSHIDKFMDDSIEDFYRYAFRAVRRCGLECGTALALRTPLAGLLKLAKAFCNEATAFPCLRLIAKGGHKF